nr:MAG TPA: hypothetical protein [Caudoviricetes sp.]
MRLYGCIMQSERCIIKFRFAEAENDTQFCGKQSTKWSAFSISFPGRRRTPAASCYTAKSATMAMWAPRMSSVRSPLPSEPTARST